MTFFLSKIHTCPHMKLPTTICICLFTIFKVKKTILSFLAICTSLLPLMFSKSSYLYLDEELPDRRERAAHKKMEWHMIALLQMEYDRGSPQTCHLVYSSIHYFVKSFCFVLILCSSQLKVTLSHKKLWKMDRICRLPKLSLIAD